MLAPVAGSTPIERFGALAGCAVTHGFIGRVPGLDVKTDRAQALARLDVYHRECLAQSGLGPRHFVTAEQVHGDQIAVLASGQDSPGTPYPGRDGIITDRSDVCLGIYVADCCAVYLVDPVRRAAGLVHSGRQGTEIGVVPNAIRAMGDQLGSRPENLIVQLSPCVRPPWYEVDFAAEIAAQCRAAGVVRVADDGTCTAAQPDRYYSYRREKGRTGRMLAFLALA